MSTCWEKRSCSSFLYPFSVESVHSCGPYQGGFCRLLSWLGHEGRLDLALAAFDWLDSRPEYFTADRFLYTRLMSMSARQPDGAPQALALFDRMCATRIRPDVVAFNAAIGAAGAAADMLVQQHFRRTLEHICIAGVGAAGSATKLVHSLSLTQYRRELLITA